jgi:hypothetical protein
MKRTVVALTVSALAVGGAGIASAKPGNGAQKAGLAAVSGNSLVGCASATGAGSQSATGFAVLNAPGKPGSPRKIVGDVAVKDAAPGTYDLRLAGPSSGSCGVLLGTLTVGANRKGSSRVAAASQGEGVYYVVLSRQPLAGVPVLGGLVTQQQYASAPVTLR